MSVVIGHDFGVKDSSSVSFNRVEGSGDSKYGSGEGRHDRMG